MKRLGALPNGQWSCPCYPDPIVKIGFPFLGAASAGCKPVVIIRVGSWGTMIFHDTAVAGHLSMSQFS
jgi:hypothetical protein